jgi:hypothetical protein
LPPWKRSQREIRWRRNDIPVVAERPMYFDYNGWTGGHDVVGFYGE